MHKNDILRSFEFEVRAQNDQDHGDQIVGRAIVFNAPTDIAGMFQEMIAPEALQETDLRDVRFLVNHNRDMIPLARSRRNNENSTMQLMVGPEGMDIRVDLDTENNEQARSLYSATKRGDISGMSFAMTVDRDEWTGLETPYPTRIIRKIGRVSEVSAVTWPAYEQTSLEARDAEALESAKAALESAQQETRRQQLVEEVKNLLKEVKDGN